MVLTRSAMKTKKSGKQEVMEEEGGAPISFIFTDITVTHTNKKRETRVIIDGASGQIKKGKVTAILGPSGAGKSTLLQLLAGRLPGGGSGLAAAGGLVPPPSPTTTALVYQEDALCAYLTVRETLTLAAELRGVGGAVVGGAVEGALRAVGLVGVADKAIGDGKSTGARRGLSGGERKRVAIGCELVAAPSALFLDEPTSGLDSFQAERVMRALQGQSPGSGEGPGPGSGATQATTVVVTLHQPSAALLQHCDEVLLLAAGGRLVYLGPGEGLGPSLASRLGPALAEALRPPLASDFELALACASVDHALGPAHAAADAARIGHLQAAWNQAAGVDGGERQGQQGQPALAASAAGKAAGRCGGGSLRRWRWLLWRSWRLAGASPGVLAMRVAMNLVTACIFGAIFHALPPTQSSVLARKGLCNVLCNYAAMTSMVKTLGVFRTETLLVFRERAARLYSVPAFYTAKVLAEVPLSIFLTALLGGTTYFWTHRPPPPPPYPAAAAHAAAECVAAAAGAATTTAAAAALGSGGLGDTPSWLPPPQAFVFMALLGLQWQVGAALGLALGALCSSVDAALELGKVLTMVSIIFGGLYFESASSDAAPLRALAALSPVKRAWEGLVANEFNHLAFEDFAGGGGGGGYGESAAGGGGGGGGGRYRHGREVLAELGLDGETTPLKSALVLAATALALHAAALALLAAKAPRFVRPARAPTPPPPPLRD